MTSHSKRKYPETEICREFYARAMSRVEEYPWLMDLHHVPNEGKRSWAAAKGIGLVPGISDYHLPSPGDGLPSLWIEMKAGNNRLTNAQKEWLTRRWFVGDKVAYFNNADDAIDMLFSYCLECLNKMSADRFIYWKEEFRDWLKRKAKK